MRVPLTRVGRTRLHAKAMSDTRWFPCCRSPARPGRRAVAQGIDQPAAEPGIGPSRIGPLPIVGDRQAKLSGMRFSVTTTVPFVSLGKHI